MTKAKSPLSAGLLQLSRDVQALQSALELCIAAQGTGGLPERSEADCCLRTRRSAEICLKGLNKLLSDLDGNAYDAHADTYHSHVGANRPRILVVDDNPANLALVEHQLEVLGWQADFAADGYGALDLWRQQRHRLVFIDKQMPGMDGLELAHAIRAEPVGDMQHVILIGTSAGNYREEIGLAKSAGMDDVLPKPFDLNDLERMLAHWLPEAYAAEAEEPLPDTELDDVPILDGDYVARVTGPIDAGKRDHLIQLFLSTSEADLQVVRQLRVKQNRELLRRTLHKLKSAAHSVGAMRFARQAAALETRVRAGDLEDMTAGIVWLEQECGRIRAAASQLLDAAPAIDLLQTISFGRMPGIVWIVDADELAREQLRLMLSGHGWGEVRSYASGEALLADTASRREADLLICDIQLPGMNCIELLCGLNESGFSGATVLTSGDDEILLNETLHVLRTFGLTLWGELRKPYHHEDFSRLLADGDNVHLLLEEKPTLQRDELLAAIHEDAFEIHFQPKVDSATLAVVGIEALARWQRHDHPVSPREFIQAAEEYGLIAPLSELLLIKALSGAAELAEAGIHLPLSINLSSSWFQSAKVPELIHACATATGVAARDVTFEMREGQILDQMDKLRNSIAQLRSQGFHLAMDDVKGNRANALESIQQLSLKELKLGHALVSEAALSPAHRSLLASCIAMAHRLNLSLVAEGVETDSALQLMRDMGCDHIQGWLIAKAMPIDALIAWLKGHTP